MYDTRLAAYFGELVEGGFVIDKSAALAERPSLAVTQPMCKGSLPVGTRDEFQGAENSFVAHALANGGPEVHGSFSTLAKLAIAAPKCGMFDDVAPDVFADWWRAHGARVGIRQGEYIVWDNGDHEAIRPFESRYAN
jgi:hypothetical protein